MLQHVPHSAKKTEHLSDAVQDLGILSLMVGEV